jgi:hypothetical protein
MINELNKLSTEQRTASDTIRALYKKQDELDDTIISLAWPKIRDFFNEEIKSTWDSITLYDQMDLIREALGDQHHELSVHVVATVRRKICQAMKEQKKVEFTL